MQRLAWRHLRDLFGVLLCLLAAHAYLDHTLMSAGLGMAPAAHAATTDQMAGMDMAGTAHGERPAGVFHGSEPAPGPASHHGANCCPLCHVTALALTLAQRSPSQPGAGHAQHTRADSPHDRPGARTHTDARAPPCSA